MTAIASAERCAEAQENLLSLLRKDEQVAGVILADNARDEGIRFTIVAKHESDTPDVYARWRAKIDALWTVLYRSHLATGPSFFRTVLLLNDFLLCDMSVTAIAHLRADPNHHQIAFDQTDGLLARAIARKELKDDKLVYNQLIHTVWEPIIYGVLALKHQEIWRSLHFLNILRERLVRLAGLRHGHDVTDYQDIEALPEMFLVQLRHTLPTSNSITAIRRALRTTITMLFGEAEVLDARFGTSIGAEMEKQLMIFVEAFA